MFSKNDCYPMADPSTISNHLSMISCCVTTQQSGHVLADRFVLLRTPYPRANADLDDLQEGVNISPYQELKIAFDGYAEDEDEFEDLNIESYAVYIHKEAASVGFVFPEHASTPWAIVQRPSDELCHFVWYDKENATYSGPALAESSENSEVSWAILEAVISELSARHSN
ncbi:hypothetical protein OAL10_11595 [Gammaproteobacteria bacterium]|nr:hypothetical protein [Gammaproteobacteria bacterium]